MRLNLKKARKDMGLTQEQMAIKLGVCNRHYQYLESGGRGGNFDIWNKLEDITGINQRILRENTK